MHFDPANIGSKECIAHSLNNEVCAVWLCVCVLCGCGGGNDMSLQSSKEEGELSVLSGPFVPPLEAGGVELESVPESVTSPAAGYGVHAQPLHLLFPLKS